MHSVKPQLVAQVRFVDWTAEGRLRHAVYHGLRTDKDAQDMRRDEVANQLPLRSRHRNPPGFGNQVAKWGIRCHTPSTPSPLGLSGES